MDFVECFFPRFPVIFGSTDSNMSKLMGKYFYCIRYRQSRNNVNVNLSIVSESCQPKRLFSVIRLFQFWNPLTFTVFIRI